MKNNLLPALIIALALLAHAYIVKPHARVLELSVPHRVFDSETQSAVRTTLDSSGWKNEVRGISIDEIRTSLDGTRVLVQYTVRLVGREITSGLVYQRDDFGRYFAQGDFQGLKINASAK